MRTIVEIPEEVIQTLDTVGKQERKSRAAIIRDAIGLYLESKEIKGAEAAYGVWKKRKRDGVHYQECLRSEWD